jgi:hypothetical protein
LNTSIIRYKNTYFLLLAVFTLSLLVAGCSDDEPGIDDPDPSTITIGGIILNPKSAGLADTLKVTAILTSVHFDPGNYAKIAWSSDEGVFLENNQQSVRWVAPGFSTLARLSVTATGPLNTVSLSADVFVGTSVTVVSQYAGELHLQPSGTDLYYLYSEVDPTDATFGGFGVYEYSGGPSMPVIYNVDTLGVDYVFTDDLAYAARTYEGGLGVGDVLAPVNLWLDDLNAQTSTKLTEDSKPGDARHDRFIFPNFSPNGNLLVYEAFRPNFLQGAIDTFDVEVYNTSTSQKTNVTRTHGGSRRNFFPSVSSDNNWVVFVSDRRVQNEWELYGLRIDNDVVRSDSSDTVRLTFTDGLISGGTPLTLTKPTTLWNPNPSLPVLAIIGNDGELRLVETDDVGATTIEVPSVGNVLNSLTWSPDGQMLALVAMVQEVEDAPFENVIYTIETDGFVRERHRVSASDKIQDITWSSGQNLMVYRASRGSSSWLELLDLEGNQGFLRPVVITATSDMGEIETYGGYMSTASVLNTSNVIYYLLFNNNTPSVNMLDISGALQ